MDTNRGAANATVSITYFGNEGDEVVIKDVLKEQCTVDLLRMCFGITTERVFYLRDRTTNKIEIAGEDGIFRTLTDGSRYELETSPAIAPPTRNPNGGDHFFGSRNVSVGSGSGLPMTFGQVVQSPRSLMVGAGMPNRLGASSTTRHRLSNVAADQNEIMLYFSMGVKMPNGTIASKMALAGGPIEIPVVLRAENISSVNALNAHVSNAVVAAGHAGPHLHYQVRRGTGALLTENNSEVKSIEFWKKARKAQTKFYVVPNLETGNQFESEGGSRGNSTAPKRKAASDADNTCTEPKLTKTDLESVKLGLGETVTKSFSTFQQEMIEAIRRSLQDVKSGGRDDTAKDPQSAQMRELLRGIGDRVMCKICYKTGATMFTCPECCYIVICPDCRVNIRRSVDGYPCPVCQFQHGKLTDFKKVILGEETANFEEWRAAEDDNGPGPSGIQNGGTADDEGDGGNEEEY